MSSKIRVPAAASLIVPGLLAVQVAAQEPLPRTPDTTVITSHTLASHVRILADDSMHGRDTPSPGLETAARYVAHQFATLGLQPAGQNGTWLQRYLLPAQFDFAQSRLVFAANGNKVAADFTSAARLARWWVPDQSGAPASVVVVAGRQSDAALSRLDVTDEVVLVIPPAGRAERSILDQLYGKQCGVVIVSDADSATFAHEVAEARARPDVQGNALWGAYIRAAAVPGLAELLTASGVDLERLRQDTTPTTSDLDALRVTFDRSLQRTLKDTTTAPNVVGMLEGTDPELKKEYVVFMAHMDHTGIRPGRDGRPDSIANGADDNASGTAALIELARAFSRPGARPARSLVFLATSGGAKNFWGSRAIAGQLDTRSADNDHLAADRFRVSSLGPLAIPLTAHSVVAVLNLDMIGRHAPDSVVVDGLDDVVLPTPPAWLAAAHPELGLTVVDGGTVTTPTSDHFAFVQWAVPSLAFHNGSHTHSTAELPSAIDTDLAARITRLVYYLGQDIANGKRRPKWTADGRQRYLELLRQP